MTCQAPEILIYEGEERQLLSEPLALSGVAERIPHGGSLCWRGYIGTWIVDNKKLYLTKLTTHEIEGATPYRLENFFSVIRGRVFAEWFSGELRCPEGECLRFVNVGFSRIYERDLFLRVEDGVVVGRRTVEYTALSKDPARAYRPDLEPMWKLRRHLRRTLRWVQSATLGAASKG